MGGEAYFGAHLLEIDEEAMQYRQMRGEAIIVGEEVQYAAK